MGVWPFQMELIFVFLLNDTTMLLQTGPICTIVKDPLFFGQGEKESISLPYDLPVCHAGLDRMGQASPFLLKLTATKPAQRTILAFYVELGWNMRVPV